MKRTIQIIALIALAVGTAYAAQPLEIDLRMSNLHGEPDGERLASMAVTLPSSLRGRRVDFATLEFWIEPSNAVADTMPFVVSAVPLVDDGESRVEAEGRWPSAVVANPRSPRRVVLIATPLLRYWMENPTVDRMMAVRISQRQIAESPSVSTSRLGSGVVGRLRVYTTH